MKNKILLAALICLALVALIRSVDNPVLAQVRAALVQLVDEPGRNAFSMSGNNSTLNPYFYTFTVPAGKRYVIDQYSANCDIVSTTSMTQVSISTSVDGVTTSHSAPAHAVQTNGNDSGTPVYAWAATGLGPVYADAGTNINLLSNALAGTGGSNIKDCSFYLSGHTISTP